MNTTPRGFGARGEPEPAPNPRSWGKPISEYRGLDIVLTRDEFAEAVARYAEDTLGVISQGDITGKEHCTLTISGDNVRVTYTWRDPDVQGALGDSLARMAELHKPETEDQHRAHTAANEALTLWRTGVEP